MTLGGVDRRLHDNDDIAFTSNASGGRDGFFSVKLRNIYMRDGSGGESAKSSKADPNEGVKSLGIDPHTVNSGGIIVDSGTTDTYWNKNIADAFKKVFQEMTGKQYNNNAMSLTKKELDAMPTILFQFEANDNENPSANPNEVVGLAGDLDPDHPHDVILAFPPSHYMEYDPDGKMYVSRFYMTERGGSVVGANAMMGHDVFFDTDNNRIGWAESSCDFTKILAKNGYPSVLAGGTTGSHDNGGGNESGISGHEGHVPSSSAAPAGFWTLIDSCDTLECRGVLVACLLMAICLGVCIGSCCRSRSKKEPSYHQVVASTEVEMSEGVFSSYKDTPDDEGSGEFEGDFTT
jgi:hypothetical protein